MIYLQNHCVTSCSYKNIIFFIDTKNKKCKRIMIYYTEVIKNIIKYNQGCKCTLSSYFNILDKNLKNYKNISYINYPRINWILEPIKY